MTLIWYVIAFPIYFDISFEFEVKRKKKVCLILMKEKKDREKSLIRVCPPGIEPVPTDSESDIQITLLSRCLK